MDNNLLKVLIVDDSPLVAPRVRSLLESFKPAIVIGESVNAEEAWDLMQDIVPDVVLLDINLPGKSGVELLKDIKATHPEVTVIVFTNHAEPYYRSICKDLGAAYFFDKSTEFEKLPEAFQEIHSSIPEYA